MSVEVRVTQLVPYSVEIQIHDVPICVQDDVIIESLGVFGSVVGPLRHGFVKTKSGLAIATGIRFATFSLRPNIRPWRIMLEKVADSARKAVKLAEPYKPYGGQFLEFCSISLSTYQTCMKLRSSRRPSTSPRTLSSIGCSTSATPVGSNVGEPAVSTKVLETDLNLKTTEVDEGTTEVTSALNNLTDTEPDMSSAQGSLSSMTAHPRTPLADVEVDIAERDLERTERLLSEVASNINTEASHTWFTPERRGRNASTESSPELAPGVKKKDSRKPTNLASGSRFSPLARV